MPDENDIVFNEYSLDIFSIIDRLWAYFFGGAEGVGSSAAGGGSSADATLLFAEFVSGVSTFWDVVIILSWIVSIILIWGLIYAYILGGKIGDVIDAILIEQEEAYGVHHNRDVKNKQWEDVKKHIDSKRPMEWRLAVIEADIVLDKLLDSLGLAGESVGEKLKSASTTSFSTLDQAWRAHKVRNRIAHEGSEFNLTKREAEETIAQYKMVFEEFDYI